MSIFVAHLADIAYNDNSSGNMEKYYSPIVRRGGWGIS
jgi:hypothetical protein